MKQYIYSLDAALNTPYSPSVLTKRTDSTEFKILNSPLSALKHLFLLLKRFGLNSEFIKVFAKLVMRRNALYIVIYNNAITSDGLLSFGKCNHYSVNINDCIIGPVYTDGSYRGKGFATFGLISCVNYLRDTNKYSKIYIDTREDNLAMMKVIEKSAFGEPKSSYQRIPNQKL